MPALSFGIGEETAIVRQVVIILATKDILGNWGFLKVTIINIFILTLDLILKSPILKLQLD